MKRFAPIWPTAKKKTKGKKSTPNMSKYCVLIDFLLVSMYKFKQFIFFIILYTFFTTIHYKIRSSNIEKSAERWQDQ